MYHDQVVCLLGIQDWINNPKTTFINCSSIPTIKSTNNHIFGKSLSQNLIIFVDNNRNSTVRKC